MEQLESFLYAPWLALGVAVASLCAFVFVDRRVRDSGGKGIALFSLGATSSIALLLAEWAFLFSLSSSGLYVLGVMTRLIPLSIATIASVWLACVPAVVAYSWETSRGWLKTGVVCAIVIWCLGSLFSGLGFAFYCMVVLLPSVVMARRACKSSFSAKPPIVSPLVTSRSHFA